MGQLGQGNTNSISNVVNVTLTSIHSPVDIAVGKYHTCVVNSAGEIECWGQNDFGQLGRGFVVLMVPTQMAVMEILRFQVR